ncbi:MAG: AAC(3) family N-acetyltransferase [Selenomonadaceae bacterium]|nr:AAC(3) family N-acetyltransferase [Selenomonadaceae bacterium]
MNDMSLFTDVDGHEFSADDIYQALLSIGADDCQTLFLHSDIMFGTPAKGFRRREYLAALCNAIDRLGVKYLITPTFTYSFCNNEPFNVVKSPTSMGALNEFIRKLPNRYRTVDPLLSLSVPIELKEHFSNLGNNSLGVDSGLDRLHAMDGVKFLFFGARLYDCFTYLHYVECMRDVPYQFDMRFDGDIIDADGNPYQRTQFIRTKCKGVTLREDEHFEDYLADHGYLRKVRLGDSYVSAISEADAFREINAALDRNVYHFLVEPPAYLENVYTYDPSARRVTHC